MQVVFLVGSQEFFSKLVFVKKKKRSLHKLFPEREWLWFGFLPSAVLCPDTWVGFAVSECVA